MTVFTPIPHTAFVEHVEALAAALAADTQWTPSLLVGIGRGGLVPAVFLSHATGLPMLSVDHSAGAEIAEPALLRVAAQASAGARLLLVDDINDTGGTIAAIRAALAAAGAPPASFRFATLIDNIRSAERVEYRARTIDRAVLKDWFIFPWEAMASDAAIALDAAEVPARTA